MAHEKSLNSKFVEADDICHRLLREPALPLLYRAGCNLLLAFGNDNPVGFAKVSLNTVRRKLEQNMNSTHIEKIIVQNSG